MGVPVPVALCAMRVRLLDEQVADIPKHDGVPSGYVKIAIENHHFEWENPLLMVIFNSYFDITRGYLLGYQQPTIQGTPRPVPWTS